MKEKNKQVEKRESDLTRRATPHRVRVYIACLVFGLVWGLVTDLGVLLDIVPPSPTKYYTLGIVAVPMYIALLTALFWDAPGENRTMLEKAAEVTLVWFLITACSQILWELPWVIGDAANIMNIGPEDHWGFAWWSYGSADVRYLNSDPGLWAAESAAVIGGCMTLFAYFKLLTTAKQNTRQHIRTLWIGFFGMAILYTVLFIYYASEAKALFNNVENTAAGILVIFYFGNSPWIFAPLLVIPSIPKQIDNLYRRLAREERLPSMAESIKV